MGYGKSAKPITHQLQGWQVVGTSQDCSRPWASGGKSGSEHSSQCYCRTASQTRS